MTTTLRRIILPADPAVSRRVFTLAFPIILGNLSRVLMNVVDVAMVGRLGAKSLAAVGLGAVLIWTILSIGIAFRTGVQTVTARRYGQKRFNDCGLALNSGLALASIVGVILAIMGYKMAGVAIRFLIDDPVVIPLALVYTQWSFVGAACITIGYAFQGFYNGVERTRIHMEVTIVSNILNIYLDAGLIFGNARLTEMLASSPLGDISFLSILWSPFDFPALGVEGAAIATLCAAVWMIIHYTLRGFSQEFRTNYSTYKGGFNRETLKKEVEVAAPQGFQEVGVTIVYVLFFKIIGMIGTVEVAATEVVFTLAMASFLPAIGFGVACATLVGKALGEKDPERAAVSMLESVRWSVIFMGTMGTLFLLFPRPILLIFTNDGEVIEMGLVALRILGVVQFFDAVGMTLWFALSGAGNTLFPAIIDLSLSWGIFLPGSYLLGIVFGYGLIGPWLAFAIYLFLYAICITWKILKGDWKKIEI
ncbi:MAG: MATE family efflux transporter [Candidatus Marinimicrobia bacterium]|jgi:putative MATE family efflux protein|nr:MATE family efflux transporter [Candidatus Neomarinimicrobiota bacterium]|tara:strand:- start:296 stop:1729 length:1434 start_codon:yes stop_codon:yes gene_type:complete